MAEKRFAIRTFGCQMNAHDSERIKGMLESLGLGEAVAPDEADVVVFNTCTIREKPDTKLAAYLAQARSDRILYIFDEPTTGLHFDDIAKLLSAFRRLIVSGGSVLVIEHNLDVIKTADWVIDLGPEGGDRGGSIVAEGRPEDIAACEASHTGRFLREALGVGQALACAGLQPGIVAKRRVRHSPRKKSLINMRWSLALQLGRGRATSETARRAGYSQAHLRLQLGRGRATSETPVAFLR